MIKKRCCDCKMPLKNRSKKTKRCVKCWFVFRKNNAHGRITGNCKICGACLSLKKNVTNCCLKCARPFQKKPKPTLKAPWNKGKTIFISKEHKNNHTNALRRKKRLLKTNRDFVSDRIRTLIRNSLKRVNAKKYTKTAQLLGCSTKEFKEHLEKQFIHGMTWGNYGNKKEQWNIDHIVPLHKFNLSDTAQQVKAFHYMNCRPLWATENFKRSRK